MAETLADEYLIEVSETTYAPTSLALEVGLYDAANGERLPVIAGDDHVTFGSIELVRRGGDVPKSDEHRLREWHTAGWLRA